MFRQKIYNENENNNLKDRLDYLRKQSFNHTTFKIYNINSNTWIDVPNTSNYKIQKEALSDDTIIFYVYTEEN